MTENARGHPHVWTPIILIKGKKVRTMNVGCQVIVTVDSLLDLSWGIVATMRCGTCAGSLEMRK
jgi:hypothetical protein